MGRQFRIGRFKPRVCRHLLAFERGDGESRFNGTRGPERVAGIALGRPERYTRKYLVEKKGFDPVVFAGARSMRIDKSDFLRAATGRGEGILHGNVQPASFRMRRSEVVGVGRRSIAG